MPEVTFQPEISIAMLTLAAGKIGQFLGTTELDNLESGFLVYKQKITLDLS